MLREIHKNSSQYKRRGVKKIIIILIFFLILLLIIFMGFRITKVNVIGWEYYTQEQITNKLIVNKLDKNSLFLYLKIKYSKDIEIPFIQKIDIEIENRNTVNINVYEKTMIGCINYMGQILYFDKDGIIVESSNRKIDYVPFIVGLKYDKLVLNEKLEVQKENLITIILHLTQLIRKYELPIEKVSFSPTNEVTLISENIRILLGKRELYDEQMAPLKSILPKTKGLSGVLDMREFSEDDDRLFLKPDK